MATREPEPGRLRLLGWSIVLLVSVAAEFGTGLVLLASTLLIPFGIGRVPASWAHAWLRWLADAHRLWSARVMGKPIPRPYRELPERSGALARLHAYRTDPATARDVGWLGTELTFGGFLAGVPFLCGLLAFSTGGFIVDRLTRPPVPVFVDGFGYPPDGTKSDIFSGLVALVLALLVFWFTTRPALRAYTWLQGWLLGPAESVRLTSRIGELTRSRADAVDTQAAEIRRIERDLHDGAQARLVALGMNLGMAEQLLAENPIAAQQLLVEAKQSTGLALSELRELVRGIHPPILADRGLAGAVEALALASAVPIDLDVRLPGRPPAPVESAMYFALTEALTNLAKHSGASSAWIRLRHEDGRLCLMVGDNGRGGAYPLPGGGLAGIERRLAGFDGIVSVASPIGGPTIVTMELPCALAFALS